MATWPTSVVTDAQLYVAVNALQTTLASTITNSVTTIPLNSATGFPTAGAVVIDSEVIFYTNISGANLTGCTRGADGTTAASHNTGVPVSAAIVAQHHNALKDEIEALETSLNLSASLALVSNASGRVAVSAVTTTELGYLSGVTSAVQTQLNTKATDSLVVHLAGTETITGSKTLFAPLRVGTPPVTNFAGTPTTGGTLATNTYYYKVYPFYNGGNYVGFPSPELIVSVTGSNHTVNFTWDAVTGATKYRIARGTSSGTQDGYFEVTTNSLSDSGQAFTGAAVIDAGQNQLAFISGAIFLPTSTGALNFYDYVTGNTSGGIAVTSVGEMQISTGTGPQNGTIIFTDGTYNQRIQFGMGSTTPEINFTNGGSYLNANFRATQFKWSTVGVNDTMILNNTNLNLLNTTNQLVFGNPASPHVTFNVPQPAASRIITFPDLGGDYNVIADQGNQNIHGVKTFIGTININSLTGSLPLHLDGLNNVVSAAITLSGTDVTGTLAVANGGTGVTSSTGSGSTVLSTSPTLVTPVLGTPTSGNLTNCTFPTLNQNTTGSAASLSISGQTGLLTITGLTSTNRIKTVRDAADTLLELGGSYTPTGTWTNLTLVTPALGTPSALVLTNATGTIAASITLNSTSGNPIHGNTASPAASSAGYIGEFIQGLASGSYVNYPSSTHYGDLTSIVLTAGTWKMSAFVDYAVNGATVTRSLFGISSTTGDSSSGLQANNNLADLPAPTGNSSGYLGDYIVTIGSSVTYYLKYQATYSAGTPLATGRLTAIRLN